MLLGVALWSLPALAQPPERPTDGEPPPLSLAQVEKIIGGRTLVSVHLENADMDAALGAAQRETGVPWRMALRTVSRGPLTLDLKEKPVWALFDALRANVEWAKRAVEGVLGHDEVPLSPSEIFQPAATRDLGLMQLRAGAGRLGKKHWIVPLTIIADPKLEIVNGSTRLRMLEATDENGLNLLGTDVTTSWYRQYPLMWSASIAQLRPDNIGTRLKKLSGVLECLVSLREEQWKIPIQGAKFPIVKRWTRDDATDTLSVDSLEKIGDGIYQMQVTRTHQSMIHSRFWKASEVRRLESFGMSLMAGLKLLDEQGRALTLQKNTLRGDLDEGIVSRTVVATFGRGPISASRLADSAASTPPGDPARIVWNIPLDTRAVQVPFSFDDISLVAP